MNLSKFYYKNDDYYHVIFKIENTIDTILTNCANTKLFEILTRHTQIKTEFWDKSEMLSYRSLWINVSPALFLYAYENIIDKIPTVETR